MLRVTARSYLRSSGGGKRMEFFNKEEMEKLIYKWSNRMGKYKILYLDHAFFRTTDYQEEQSHKQAILQFLNNKDHHFNKKDSSSIENIIFSELLSFDHLEQYPILVNPALMRGSNLSYSDFFADYGHYTHAFLYGREDHSSAEKDFYRLNKELFPEQERLVIKEWNDDWSTFFRMGRRHKGNRLFTVYDPQQKRITVIYIPLVEEEPYEIIG